ncbi:MAG: glycoside hydrolase, family 57 [Gammaproteobacteria bacterium]|nr:MAG: glycoside hydrolase, family 57 [Gammaproteobacteria bacterium]
MHQPEYRDRLSGTYQLPWTYLHAIKDYVDMAVVLENTPGARAVVNFAPILLEQIDDYTKQIQAFLNDRGVISDPLLAALDMPALPVVPEERMALIKACLKVNRHRLINRFAPFRQLAEIADGLIKQPQTLKYIDEQYLVDIVVWYHLAWLGETVRRSDARVKRLIEKGSTYTLHERRELLVIIGELMSAVIGRYRALAERGQVELSVTPYAHPILPLLLDLGAAAEATPDVRMPVMSRYPGGMDRANYHIEEGIATFRRQFGFTPAGCWPAEGGVSTKALELLARYGFKWAATGQGVFQNTIKKHGIENNHDRRLHRSYRIGKGDAITCFFRDDGLSDLIGFTYSDWHADDAVANLVAHLETIANHCAAEPDSVVSIILDGENAWEYYPENGYHFLKALYARLASHPRLELTTFSDALGGIKEPQSLPGVVAGSWVYGTFSTWIGSADKNRGWDMLCEAKRAFDTAVASGRLADDVKAAAARQLAVCEGSDWCWWFGDENPAGSVSDFERLYRIHLASLYQIIGEEPPENLSHVVSHGGGDAARGGVMRKSTEGGKTT